MENVNLVGGMPRHLAVVNKACGGNTRYSHEGLLCLCYCKHVWVAVQWLAVTKTICTANCSDIVYLHRIQPSQGSHTRRGKESSVFMDNEGPPWAERSALIVQPPWGSRRAAARLASMAARSSAARRRPSLRRRFVGLKRCYLPRHCALMPARHPPLSPGGPASDLVIL